MLHVQHRGAAVTPDPVMQSMFAARKTVFVDLLKWDVPVIAGAFEIDQFDDEHARYLVLADDAGRHLGSARLLQTSRPHILDSLYPALCARRPPCSDDIFEITRFCLDRSLCARERRAVRDTLIRALVDHALASGISAYSATAEAGWLRQILAFGWRCRLLGAPLLIAGKRLGAVLIKIDPDTPERLTACGVVARPALPGCDARIAA
jgi:N-acyl-L-homoserine lactone synthetase